jgi:hypothetical protein
VQALLPEPVPVRRLALAQVLLPEPGPVRRLALEPALRLSSASALEPTNSSWRRSR